jgi:hypothetical protein
MKRIFTLLFIVTAFFATSQAQQTVFCENWTGYDTTTADANYNGWTLTYYSNFSFYTSTQSSGPSGPNSYKFGVDSATAITPNILGADQISFWMKGNAATGGTLANGKFYIYETSDGTTYNQIDMINPIPTTAATKTYSLSPGTTNVKFFYDKDSGNVAFDDFCATIVNGISDVSKAFSFSAYPNPSRGTVNLNIAAGKTATVVIANMLGSELKHFTLKSNELTSTLDLSDLNEGVYMIKVKSDAGEATQRLIIRR